MIGSWDQWLRVGGTFLSASAEIASGNAAAKAANLEALQLLTNSRRAEADSTRTASDIVRQGRMLQGDMRAAAAAGGGAVDAGTIDEIAGAGTTTQYNALSTLYQGRAQAQGLRNQAAAARYSGAVAKSAGRIRGLATALSGAADLYRMSSSESPKSVSAPKSTPPTPPPVKRTSTTRPAPRRALPRAV